MTLEEALMGHTMDHDGAAGAGAPQELQVRDKSPKLSLQATVSVLHCSSLRLNAVYIIRPAKGLNKNIKDVVDPQYFNKISQD